MEEGQLEWRERQERDMKQNQSKMLNCSNSKKKKKISIDFEAFLSNEESFLPTTQRRGLLAMEKNDSKVRAYKSSQGRDRTKYLLLLFDISLR